MAAESQSKIWYNINMNKQLIAFEVYLIANYKLVIFSDGKHI